MAVVPWLLGWDYPELDDELRKSFEVALHAGTAAGLLIALGSDVRAGLRAPRLRLIALASAPPGLAGFVLQRPIERHLGTPPTIACGLLAGAVAMAWADRASQRRGEADAGTADALCLGLAQACALIPGVSRSGATLAAARLRHFDRTGAQRLSRQVALPPIAGASLLMAVRLRRRGLEAGAGAALLTGAASAFASTLASVPLLRRSGRGSALLPYSLYRVGLAAAVLRRVHRSRKSGPDGASVAQNT